MKLTRRLSDVKNIKLMGDKFDIKIESIDDMPKLIEALQTWNRFESAQAYQRMYMRFKECREREFNDEVVA